MFPAAIMQDKAASVLHSPSPPEEFWVDKGVYYTALEMGGRKVTIALHGVSTDQQAATAVCEFRRKFGAAAVPTPGKESI
jgi:hypothetical protein